MDGDLVKRGIEWLLGHVAGIVPVGRRRSEFRLEARTHRGVLEALDQFRVTAIVRPRGNERRQVVVPSRVGVRVGPDIDARGTGAVDARDDLRHKAEVADAAGLEMPDLDRNVRVATYADRLVDRHWIGIGELIDLA